MRLNPILKKYLHDLAEIARRGDAREESFYGALSGLLTDIAATAGRADIQVTTQPRPTDAGNPDFRIWNGTDRVIGYIEAKKPAEERLDLVEESEQLRRYRATFPNLILTNFLEFRLYRDGQRVESVLLARPVVLNQLRSVPPAEKPAELAALLARFEGAGDGRVARGKGARYDAGAQRVYINAAQHFAPVPPEVWAYQVGGY